MAVPLFKVIGTVSLGLLTGVSYTLSTQTLPALLTLPSAKSASNTFRHVARLSALHITALSAVSSLSLGLAFVLSPARIRHPYLLWTSLAAAGSGALTLAGKSDLDGSDVNGEEVEKTTRAQQYMEFVRTGISGLGFAMGVVGIWGDGA
ncbi:hypothetical protein K470DRAFT_213030 [Piedraia hortae CBS 480.64]|uniref:Uncharacterized protein n=1 Tax=Piedraia hortae CBS 480.64 TaxID=1314780 RepID=A0A6A7C511_9PEZI|nr:hypothetical protein K470DRAFT_213030 [Piedraia hortae CBS 480.64]